MAVPYDIDALKLMIREAPPGSWLALAPDVFDECQADLAIEVASIVGHSMTIQRSCRLPPGTFAVMDAPRAIGGQSSGFMTSFGPRTTPVQSPAQAAKAKAKAKMTPPRPPKPTPPPAPRPQPGPRPRVRIIDT